ncbi:PBP1A family penicillin-binding protein [bacterium]|nr:PBP1A family penicillin-binding protein [bacterium]
MEKYGEQIKGLLAKAIAWLWWLWILLVRECQLRCQQIAQDLIVMKFHLQSCYQDYQQRSKTVYRPSQFKKRHRIREWWRRVKRAWHHHQHKKTKLKKANAQRIEKYLRRKQRVNLARQGASGTQVFWGVTSFVVTFGLLFGSWWFYEHIIAVLPDISQLVSGKQNMTTKILDRNNQLLFEIYEDENRTPISLYDVSPDVINATIAIEDRTFREHKGFDLKAILRAFLANQETGGLGQGASTITQQLVKQRLLTSEKTYTRKIKEIILAVLVEGNFSKDEILEMYLNQVNYGGSVYGIEQAAVTFFGKNAKNLSLAESAFLAGLPQAPSRYSPFAGDLESSYKRRAEVLRRMREDGYITPEEEAKANSEELVFNTSKIQIKAPHFVMYVRQLLADKYGEEMVNTGGLVVRTTLDLDLQNQVQQIVTNEVDGLVRMRVSNGAAMVTRPATGEILAMVGSRDYFDFENDGQVNVCTRLRQPGSSIKPVTYATAMEYHGFTPATLILDAPITYTFKGGPSYSPKNYDGGFHGNVSVRSSLANSYNIPAVKTLNEVGIDNMIDQAQKMGIDTWEDRSRFGLSLTLGGGEVHMTDMMEVYGTFANNGVTIKEDPFLEIFDYKGRVLYHNDCALAGQCAAKATQSLSPTTSYQISSILSDNRARTPAFGANSVLHIPGQEVAVKTGTTNSLRDNWTFGYTNDYVVGTWVGNNDNRPMSYIASGITGASPMWQKIMLSLLDPDNPSHFEVPAGIVKVNYCGREEVFKEGMIPREVCPSVPKKEGEGNNNNNNNGENHEEHHD